MKIGGVAREILDVPAPTLRAPLSAMVCTDDKCAARGQLLGEPVVATGMLGASVDDHDHPPRRVDGPPGVHVKRSAVGSALGSLGVIHGERSVVEARVPHESSPGAMRVRQAHWATVGLYAQYPSPCPLGPLPLQSESFLHPSFAEWQ